MAKSRVVKRRSGPRPGHKYPVKPEWQESVRNALEKRNLKVKDFAKLVGCGQSTMHELLNGTDTEQNSTLVPRIHELLGWDPPPDPGEASPLPSQEGLALGHMFDQLPDPIRRQIVDQARTYLDLLDRKPDN